MGEADHDAFSDDNDTHNFFTNTLKRTLELLRPFIPKAKKAADKSKQVHPASVEDITNRFSALEIEDLADQDLEDTTNETAPKQSATPRITYVVDQGKEDLWVAIQFLLDDFHRLKTTVSTTLTHFATDKDLGLITAAATTQAAMKMLKTLVHELGSSFPHMTSMEDLCLEQLREPLVRRCILTDDTPATSESQLRVLYFPESLIDMGCLGTYK